ncbi:MAG: hypothetical protein NW203_13050 [Hyphomonadaceae bacterium]|nr:hypothetical protein [Hyphomonadaceae bacterium]
MMLLVLGAPAMAAVMRAQREQAGRRGARDAQSDAAGWLEALMLAECAEALAPPPARRPPTR